jgi:hypothetical protein
VNAEKRKWSKRKKLFVWVLVPGMLLFVLLTCFRARWITPLPGIDVEMTRPHVTESSLGPSSAYSLYLRALAEIAKAEAADPDTNVRFCYAAVLSALDISVTRADEPLPDAELPDPSSWNKPQVQEPAPPRVWGYAWKDALEKLRHHPWPTRPPPAAPPPEPGASTMGMFGGGSESDPHTLAIRREAPWTLEQYEEIRHGLALHRPAMALLDKALAAPNPQVPTYDSLFSIEQHHEQWTQSLCSWLCLSAHAHASAGDYAAARRDLRRALDAAALITRGGSAMDHLAAWSCGATIATSARAMAASYPLPRAILLGMAADFRHQADSAEPYVECVRADLLSLRSLVSEYYAYEHFTPVGYPEEYRPWHERLIARLAFAVAPLAGSTPKETTRNVESLYQHWIALATKPYSADAQDAYDAIKELWYNKRSVLGLVLATRDPLGYNLVRGAIGYPDRLHACSTMYDAVLRGTALTLTIRAYSVDHAALPSTLSELVPDYLPSVPIDPFSTKPFRYLRSGVPGLPEDAWAIYSFGANGADDGGTAYSAPLANPFRQPDFVLPSQPYPREWRAKQPSREWHPRGRSKTRFDCRRSSL